MHLECVMRPDLIVLFQPDVDRSLSFPGRMEPFSVEDFVAQCSVEALVISVFPRAFWIDWIGLIATLTSQSCKAL